MKELPNGLLREVHGDTCRLGYFKLLACLAQDFQPYSQVYFTGRLYDVVKDYQKKWDFQGLSDTGLITRDNVKNYVLLAYELGILDGRNQTLGETGRVYKRTTSAKKVLDYINRESSRVNNVLILDRFERSFFLAKLLEHDSLMLWPIIDWLADQKIVMDRATAMNYVMETIYPAALENLAHDTTDFASKHKLLEEANRAKNYEKERLSISPQQWANSQLYAKYRHTAPPRFEWLIDVGLINKDRPGKYDPTDALRAIDRNMIQRNQDIFYHVNKVLFSNFKELSASQAVEYLLETYSMFSKMGYLTIDKKILYEYMVYESLVNNILLSRSTFDASVKQLEKKKTGSVQHLVDMYGNPVFIKINLSKIK